MIRGWRGLAFFASRLARLVYVEASGLMSYITRGGSPGKAKSGGGFRSYSATATHCPLPHGRGSNSR